MRPALLSSVFGVMPVVLSAQELKPGAEIPVPPPAYKMLRFDEDYSCLTNPASHTDWFDPVTVQASYVHFFTGTYVHEAGGKDVDYFSTTISFLF